MVLSVSVSSLDVLLLSPFTLYLLTLTPVQGRYEGLSQKELQRRRSVATGDPVTRRNQEDGETREKGRPNDLEEGGKRSLLKGSTVRTRRETDRENLESRHAYPVKIRPLKEQGTYDGEGTGETT